MKNKKNLTANYLNMRSEKLADSIADTVWLSDEQKAASVRSQPPPPSHGAL